jgi:hypothetical protein
MSVYFQIKKKVEIAWQLRGRPLGITSNFVTLSRRRILSDGRAVALASLMSSRSDMAFVQMRE